MGLAEVSVLQRLLFVLAVSVVVAAPAAAQGPVIEHQPVACVAAGRFPQLEARFAPVESVARARVMFQPEGGRHWYGVAMKAAGPVFSAVLPKPKKSLKSYRYYLEVTDTALGTSRTGEYSTTVAAGAAACADKKVAGGLGSATVRLEVPAGAPSVPGGFSTSGVIAAGAAGAAVAAGATTAAAAGGGISTAAVLIGGGLAVAGAGAAVVAAGRSGNDGNGGDQGGGGQTVYSGPYNGQFVQFMHYNNGTCSATFSLSGTATIRLDQATGAVTGSFSAIGTGAKTADTCPGANTGLLVGNFLEAPLTGTAGALEARLQQGPTTVDGVAVTTITNVYAFTGALSGGVITGMITFTHSGDGTPQPGQGFPFTTDGSATIPVTLR